jgi:hypothetical protein
MLPTILLTPHGCKLPQRLDASLVHSDRRDQEPLFAVAIVQLDELRGTQSRQRCRQSCRSTGMLRGGYDYILPSQFSTHSVCSLVSGVERTP